MPLVVVTTAEAVAPDTARQVADAVHEAVVAAGFPESDRFQRLMTAPAATLLYDPRHPDLARDRSERFVLVEITISEGRDRAFKKALAAGIAERASAAASTDPQDVMVLIRETARENWAFRSGRLHYVEEA